jgi:hypothetical protein
MQVAQVREPDEAQHVEVVFLESARFYRLLKTNPTFARSHHLLKEALAKSQLLMIRLASLESDVIEEVSVVEE